MLPIDAGLWVTNALAIKDAPEADKNELTLCREAAARETSQTMSVSLVPGFLRRMIRQWRLQAELERSVLRLAETSPHLLKDIGILGGLHLDNRAPEGAKAGVEVIRQTPPVVAPRPVVRVVTGKELVGDYRAALV